MEGSNWKNHKHSKVDPKNTLLIKKNVTSGLSSGV